MKADILKRINILASSVEPESPYLVEFTDGRTKRLNGQELIEQSVLDRACKDDKLDKAIMKVIYYRPSQEAAVRLVKAIAAQGGTYSSEPPYLIKLAD